MGRLIYAEDVSVEIEDRALAHLQVVIVAKLRRQELCAFTWDRGTEAGSGRSSIWISPSAPLQFRYWGKKDTRLNRHWIDALMIAANSTDGLRLLPEPESPSPTTA
jgi:hypothetical protein